MSDQIIVQMILWIVLVGLAVTAGALAVLVCHEARECISNFRNERKERAALRSVAKYESVVGTDGRPVKLATNHAGLRAMNEAELDNAIDYYEDQDRYLAEARLEAQRRGLAISA